MYLLQISLEGLADWLESKFRTNNAPFNKIYERPKPPTTSPFGKLKGLRFEDGGFTVILIDLNYILEFQITGLTAWLAAENVIQVMYTNWFIDGRRVLEFRKEVNNEDVVVGYAVDNRPPKISRKSRTAAVVAE